MSKDYAEILLQAMDAVSSKRIEAVKFDTTDSATIIETVDADQGKYMVSTGTAKYVAYSVNTKYRVGDSVYVTIPNGDYEQQKIIIGKQVTNDSKPFVYTAPFDTIVNISENLIPSTVDIHAGLRANCYYDQTAEFIRTEAQKDNGEIQKKIWERDFDKENLIGYTRLGIQAQFMSWLYTWRTISGDYGLKLILTYKTKNCESYLHNYEETLYKLNGIFNYEDTDAGRTAQTNDWNWILNSSFITILEEQKTLNRTNVNALIQQTQSLLDNLQGSRVLYFGCSNFYGDPYNFNTYFQQEVVFDISSLGEDAQITKMELYFYQVPGTFFRQSEEPVPYRPDESPFGDQETDFLSPNLFVKDPYICVGFGVGEFTEDDLSLYTVDSLTYSYVIPSNYTEEDWLRKTLQLRWIHEYADGTISEVKNVTAEGLPQLNYEIRWYRYELGAPAPDPYAGVYWRRIERNDARSFSYEISGDNKLKQDLPEEKFKVIILLYTLEEDGHQYCTDIYRSNVLTFTNEDEVVSQKIIDSVSGFFLDTNDNTNGNYFIYGQNGNIKEQPDAKQIRQLQCFFKPSDKITPELLTEATKIIWRFPAGNSMIQLADIASENFVVRDNDWIGGAINRTISTDPSKHAAVTSFDEVETWEIAPSFIINQFGDYSEKYELGAYTNGNYGQKNSSVIYHVAWSKVWYDIDTNEYVIGYKGDKDSNYFINPVICYQINSTYQPSATSNTVTCIIEKNGTKYTVSKTMRFGPAGTNGSPYTLVVEFDDATDRVLTQGIDEDDGTNEPTGKKSIQVSAKLLNTTGREEVIETGHYEWSWLEMINGHATDPNSLVTITQDTSNLNDKIKLSHLRVAPLHSTLFYLVCTLTGFGSYDLVCVTPIAVRSNESYIKTGGPEIVTYKSTGYPDYYTGPFTIKRKIDNGEGQEDLTNLVWDIYNPDEVLDNFKGEINVPTYTLKPCGIYVKDAGQYGVQCMQGNDILWTQPIFCCQNEYPSSTLNEWDGKGIELDESKGTIVSPAIAAGKKNRSDNTFSGVLLGDWSNQGRIDTASELTEQTGIYGLNHGSVSYAFMEDGTAFIGKSGMGRIRFDGAKSVIESEAYAQQSGGMHIDLDDGLIDMQGTIKIGNNSTTLVKRTENNQPYDSGTAYYVSNNTYASSGSRIKIQTQSPYLSIKTEDYQGAPTQGTEILHIGSDDYFLQSDDWNEEASDFFVPARTGEVNSNNFKNYYLVNGNNYELDDKSSLTTGRNYYVKNGNNYINAIVTQYSRNSFYTHFILDSSTTYTNQREYYLFDRSNGTYSQINNMEENIYEPSKYYYRTYLDYKLSTAAEINENLAYFEQVDQITFNQVNLINSGEYEQNNCYYYNENNVLVVDTNALPTKGRVYYKRNLIYEAYKDAGLIITYSSIKDTYRLVSATAILATGAYNANISYCYIDEDQHYKNANLTNPNSSEVYGFYDPFEDSFTEVNFNNLQGGLYYYKQVVLDDSGDVPIYAYEYVGMLYVPGYYYILTDSAYELVETDIPYNPQSNETYYTIVNGSYQMLTAEDFAQVPSNFRSLQNSGQLYLQAYSQTDLEWHNDIEFYTYNAETGNYVKIQNQLTFDMTSSHYIKTYYQNTGSWYYYNKYYIKDSEHNIYNYENIGEQWSTLYQPNRYYIRDGSSDLYYDTLLTISKQDFNNIISALKINPSNSTFGSSYFSEFGMGDNGEFYASLLDGNGLKVKVVYNIYEQNKYYYINNSTYDLYSGDIYNSEYAYFIYQGNNYLRCYFYEPNTYYYQTNTYIKVPSDATYNSNITYYKQAGFSGTRINIKEGEIRSYNLRLLGYRVIENNGNYITQNIEVSSQHETYPLKIGVQSEDSSKETFKVNWDGKLFSTAANIGGWEVTSDKIQSSGNGNQKITLYSNGSIEGNYSATNKTGWKIDKDGNAYFNSGNIGGWVIDNKSLHYGTIGQENSVYLQPAGTTSDTTIAGKSLSGLVITAGSNFGVTKDGSMYSSKGEIGGWTIDSKSLHYGTVGTSGSVYLQPAGMTSSVYIAGAQRSNLVITAGQNFGVTKDGAIYSSSGEIAGWTISSSRITKTAGNFYVALCSPTGYGGPGNNGVNDVLVVRNGTNSDNYTYPFVLTSDGTVTATKANISGTISASSISGGSISGSTISGSTINGGWINGGTISGGWISGTEVNASRFAIGGTYYWPMHVPNVAWNLSGYWTTFVTGGYYEYRKYNDGDIIGIWKPTTTSGYITTDLNLNNGYILTCW